MQNNLYTVSEINHQNNMLVLHLACPKGMIPFGQGDEVTVRKEVRKSARTADMQSLVDAAGQTTSPVEKLLREDFVHDDLGWREKESTGFSTNDQLIDQAGRHVAGVSKLLPEVLALNDIERASLKRQEIRRQANIHVITNAQRMYRVLHWLVEARRASDLSTLLFNIEVADDLLEEIRTGK